MACGANAGRRFIPLPDTLRRYKYVDLRQEADAAFEELVMACCDPQTRLCAAQTPKAPPEMGLRFVTNRLDNDEFLFSGVPWPFPTDPRGEDISSKHTPRSKRQGLATHRPFSSLYTTIAANEIIVDFHLLNLTDTSRYLEMLYLTVEQVFPVTAAMHWNTWLPILEPHRFEVVLDPSRGFYEIGLDGRLIEIAPKAAEHFRLEIHGGPPCANHIFRFRLGAAAHDAEGTKEETVSDRMYNLAFSKENFTPHVEETYHDS